MIHRPRSAYVLSGVYAKAKQETGRVPKSALAGELARRRAEQDGRGGVLRRLLAAADLGAATLAGFCSLLVAELSLARGLVMVALVTIGWLGIAIVANLYGADDLRSWASGVQEVPRTLLGGLILSWPLFGAATLLGAGHPLRAAVVAAFATAVLSPLARARARHYVHRAAPLKQRCVIVGSGRVADQVVERLAEQPEFGLVPFGIVDDDPHPVGAGSLPTLGRLGDLEDILRVHHVDRVIIAFSRASHEQLLRVIRAARDRRVAIDIVPRLFEFLGGSNALDQVGGLPLLSVGAPQLASSARAIKRFFDVVASVLALVVLAPLIVVAAIAVRLGSGAPVLERRARAGRGGIGFDELWLKCSAAGETELTGVGSFLKRHSLDGLPRLVNVLRGQMSLVGPRPISAWEPDRAPEVFHQRRLDLRPGITGPWQVSARAEDTLEDVLRQDYQYVSGWSVVRDIEILLASVPGGLFGRPALHAE